MIFLLYSLADVTGTVKIAYSFFFFVFLFAFRICETDFFNVMLDLFKQYCWNNILHSQVKKCFTYAFSSFEHREDNPSALITHVSIALTIQAQFLFPGININYRIVCIFRF